MSFRKAIYKQIEMKGDGSDPDYIQFSGIDYNPSGIFIQETPPLAPYYNNNSFSIRPWLSLDGEEYFEYYPLNYAVYTNQHNSRTAFRSNGCPSVPYVRIPLRVYKEKGYVGKITAQVNFY